jgi:hypothetical protein
MSFDILAPRNTDYYLPVEPAISFTGLAVHRVFPIAD